MSVYPLGLDLAGVAAGHRWPAFASAGAERGVRGTFAFPVGAGAAKVGVLSVYRWQPGPLQADQVKDGLVFADAVFVLALDHRRGLSADLDEVIEAAFTARRAEVHQAAGLVAAQQRIGVTDALALLRAHAYSSGLPLHRIATDVMAGRLRLGRIPGGLALTLGIFLSIGLGYGVVTQIYSTQYDLVGKSLLVVATMHFWYDGFIWSVRRQQVS